MAHVLSVQEKALGGSQIHLIFFTTARVVLMRSKLRLVLFLFHDFRPKCSRFLLHAPVRDHTHRRDDLRWDTISAKDSAFIAQADGIALD